MVLIRYKCEGCDVVLLRYRNSLYDIGIPTMMALRPSIMLESKEEEAEDTWADTPHPDAYVSSGSRSDSDSSSGRSDRDCDSDASEVGFKPTFEKAGDVIPRQSVFYARAIEKMHLVRLQGTVPARLAAIVTCMTFLLRSEYVPFHRAYRGWRQIVHERCKEFMCETAEPSLCLLCTTFMAKFPV